MSREAFTREAAQAAGATWDLYHEHPKLITGIAVAATAGVVIYASERAYEYAKENKVKTVLGIATIAATVVLFKRYS
jgi:hypothetical protein